MEQVPPKILSEGCSSPEGRGAPIPVPGTLGLDKHLLQASQAPHGWESGQKSVRKAVRTHIIENQYNKTMLQRTQQKGKVLNTETVTSAPNSSLPPSCRRHRLLLPQETAGRGPEALGTQGTYWSLFLIRFSFVFPAALLQADEPPTCEGEGSPHRPS